MKLTTILLSFVFSFAALAAQVDGKWVTEMKVSGGKKNASQQQTVPVTFNLKSQGAQVSGTVLMSRGKKARPMEIKDGKIDGDRITFTTVTTGKKGEKKQDWKCTLAGAELRGSTGKGKRSSSFVAKRSAA